MTDNKLQNLSARDFVAKFWGDDVLNVIERQNIIPMTISEFFEHCISCGGNWGAMLLTGIKNYILKCMMQYPTIWECTLLGVFVTHLSCCK